MILLIILAIILFGGSIGFAVYLVNDGADGEFIGGVLVIGFIGAILCLAPITVIDKGAGMTIGTITSVDKNFWGSTAIYIKTSETEQEKYCAEDEDIIKFAEKMIGQRVRIGYGERVGIYPLSKCDQAPIIHIEKWEDLTNENN